MPRQGVKCEVKIRGQYIIFFFKTHVTRQNLSSKLFYIFYLDFIMTNSNSY